MTIRFRDKGFPEENCPSCHKGCLACFDAGKSYVQPVQDELNRLRQLIVEALSLHQESRHSETVSYCIMCAERWPCESVAILSSDDAYSGTKAEGVATS